MRTVKPSGTAEEGDDPMPTDRLLDDA